MNYLRGAFTAASQYYNGLPPINASTLTGAIDVIVIERLDENGNTELACSPFHVRFGKWQVLRPGEKQVTVLVNGNPIPYAMKIGDAGEAFFVFETEEDVPQELITSPILGPTEVEGNEEAKRKHANAGRFGAESSGSDEDTDEGSQKSIPHPTLGRLSTKENGSEPSFLDLSANAANSSRSSLVSPSSTPPLQPSSPPTSVSTLDSSKPDEPLPSPSAATPGTFLGRTASFTKQISKSVLSVGPGVANLAKSAVMNGPDMAADSVHRLGDKVRATRERHHEDGSTQQKGDEALPDIDEEVGKPPEVQYGKDVVLDMSGYHGDGKASPGSEGDGTPLTAVPGIRPTFFSSDSALPSSTGVIHDSDLTPRPSLSYESGAHADGIELTRSQSSPGPTLDRPWPESNLPHPDISISEPQSSTQTHLNTAKLSKLPHSRSSGPSGIRGGSAPPELEPPSSQIPEEYSWEWGAFPTRSPARHAFPLSDDELEARGPSHLRNSSVKSDGDFEQTFGEGGKLSPDPNNKYLIWVILGSGKLSFELSLCGDYLMGSDPKDDAKYFSEYLVDYDRLLREPRIVEHRDLVMKWDDRYITKEDSSALMRTLAIWREATVKANNQSRPTSPVSDDEASHPPISTSIATTKRTSGSTWSRWWSRSRIVSASNGPNTPETKEVVAPAPVPAPSNKLAPEAALANSSLPPTQAVSSSPNPEKHYAKTLRLTSDQLKSLNLKKGANTITFSLSSTGAVACTARIFVWDYTDHIVVSDIDGTITKSDALGHVFTMIGRDWTHLGVAKLYTDISRNGYKLMYLTSRAIGQADSTRDYLKGIKQNNYQLPEGPVIMSPDRLMASLHREVIMKKPEVFKMACLRDIQRLFGPMAKDPFYAGFGNRITDALSYRSVNIPSARIFTIDSTGEVKMELLELAGYKSSYIHMSDLVDQMFPPVNRKWAQEYTDFNYWRDPVPEFDLPNLDPPSPALSAVSDASGGSRLSRLRTFSLRRKGSGADMGDIVLQAAGAVEGQFSRDRPRPTSPLSNESVVADQESLTDSEEDEERHHAKARRRLSFDSMPGSLPSSDYGGDSDHEEDGEEGADDFSHEHDDDYDDEEPEEEEPVFPDALLDGGLESVPF